MLSENIKEARELLNITKIELSRRSGVSISYVTSLENSVSRNPSLSIISAIAKALEVTTEQLTGNNSEVLKGTITVGEMIVDVILEIKQGMIIAHTTSGNDLSGCIKAVVFKNDLGEV